MPYSFRQGGMRLPSNQAHNSKPKSLGAIAKVVGHSIWRSVYNSLVPMQNVVTTMSFLRLESVLGSSNTITFKALINEGTTIVTEHRLNQSDAFVIVDFAVFIKKTPAGHLESTQVLDSFPNPLVYTGANEAENLNALYNAYLSLRVNSTVYIDSLDTRRFLRVGVAQAGLQVSTNTNPAYGASEVSDGNYGFFQTVPSVVITGADKIEFAITLPQTVDLSGTASQNTAVLFMRGFLRQNASQFRPKDGKWSM